MADKHLTAAHTLFLLQISQ